MAPASVHANVHVGIACLKGFMKPATRQCVMLPSIGRSSERAAEAGCASWVLLELRAPCWPAARHATPTLRSDSTFDDH